MAEQKASFAAIPMRAMGDERLSALDLRVLMAVAAHDRLKANGTGCYASHGRLAALVGCHLKSLSRSMKTLGDCGYIIGRTNPLNQRTRIYNVVYTEFDGAFLKSGGAPTGNEPVTYQAEIGNEFVPFQPPIGNQLSEIHHENQKDDDVNIFCEAENISSEADLINSAEAAPLREKAFEKVPGKSVGSMLAMVERFMNAGKLVGEHRDYWLGWLDVQISDGGLEYNTPDYQRAFRLYTALEDAR